MIPLKAVILISVSRLHLALYGGILGYQSLGGRFAATGRDTALNCTAYRTVSQRLNCINININDAEVEIPCLTPVGSLHKNESVSHSVVSNSL